MQIHYILLKSFTLSFLNPSLDPHFIQCKWLPKPSPHLPKFAPRFLPKINPAFSQNCSYIETNTPPDTRIEPL